MIRTAVLVRFAALACLGVTLTACSSDDGPNRRSTPPSMPPSMPPSSAPGPISTVTPDLATAMASAARALTAVTSYDYRHFDASRASAERYLADPFRSQYDSSWANIEAQAGPQKAVVKGQITNVAVSQVKGDETTVLAFAQQTVTNKDARQPRIQTVTLRATVTRAGGWPVSHLDVLGSTAPAANPPTSWVAPDVAAGLLAAQQCAVNITGIDGPHFDARFQAALGCTFGELRSQLRSAEARLRSGSARSGTRSARVVGIGISSISADQVHLLIAAAATATPRTGKPTAALNRMIATLQRTSGQWLLAKVEYAGVR